MNQQSEKALTLGCQPSLSETRKKPCVNENVPTKSVLSPIVEVPSQKPFNSAVSGHCQHKTQSEKSSLPKKSPFFKTTPTCFVEDNAHLFLSRVEFCIFEAMINKKRKSAGEKRRFAILLGKIFKKTPILELFQKIKAEYTQPSEVIYNFNKLAYSLSLWKGEVCQDIMYWLYQQLPVYLQRRLTYYRHRQEKKKLISKIKQLLDTFENMENTGELSKLDIDKSLDIQEQIKLLKKTYNRIKSCSRVVGSYYNNYNDDVKLATDVYCNSRWCSTCAERRKEALRKKYEVFVENVKNPFMVTLTLKNPSVMNKKTLIYFKNCIKQLWDRRLPKYVGTQTCFKHVRGFVRSVEVVLKKNGDYNLHAHLIVDYDENYTNHTSYDAMKEILSDDWKAITGNSYIVDIEKITSEHHYKQAIKYIFKPAEFVEGKLNQIYSMIMSFHRQHSIQSYGIFRNNEEIRKAIKELNEFDSQKTYDELVNENKNQNEIDFEVLNDRDEEVKILVNLVAYEWVKNGKHMKKQLKPVIRLNNEVDYYFTDEAVSKVKNRVIQNIGHYIDLY